MSNDEPKKPEQIHPPKPIKPIDIRINFLKHLAKQLQVVGVLAFLIGLPLAYGIVSRQPQVGTLYPVEESGFNVDNAEAQSCYFGGGEWQYFNNTCLDMCPELVAPDSCEPLDSIQGCECGEGQCWDGEKCVLQ